MLNLSLLHPAIVHFPIALLLVGSGGALVYIYVRQRPDLLAFAWWSLILGWIGTGAAVLSGLVAQRGLPPQPEYGAVLNWHIGTGMALIIAYGFLFYRRWLRRPKREKKGQDDYIGPGTDLLDDTNARLWVTLLLGLGIILVLASGWSGGKLVYEWGVNILLP